MKVPALIALMSVSLFADVTYKVTDKVKSERMSSYKNKHMKLEEEALKSVSKRLGVSSLNLAFFHEIWNPEFQVEKSRISFKTDSAKSYECIEGVQDNFSSRSNMLSCLISYARPGANIKAFETILKEKHMRTQASRTTEEAQKTVALLFLLEDIFREVLEDNGVATSWFIPGLGFKTSRDINDFDYQDGDVVLEIGTTSISALISQSTYPQRKFSHAMMLSVQEGKPISTMEALLESGTVARDFSEDIAGANVASLVTLRLKKDFPNREAVIKHATECALNHVAKNTEYDFPMDASNDEKIFCSELVASCYARAIEKYAPEESIKTYPEFMSYVTPMTSKVKHPNISEFLKRFGIVKNEMPSPGDLMASPIFEVAGVYRMAADKETGERKLNELWDMIGFGDSLTELLMEGYRVKEMDAASAAINGINIGVGSAKGLIGNSSSLLPAGIDGSTATSMGYLEYRIYRKARTVAERTQEYLKVDDQRASLIKLPIYKRKAYMRKALEENFWLTKRAKKDWWKPWKRF